MVGMPYFSDTLLAALAAPEPNGENRKLTLSSVISRSADLHGARRVRGIVDIDDLDLVGLAADLDAALGVGGLGPEIVAALLLHAFRRQRPGQRQRRADAHQVLRGRGGAEDQRARERQRRDDSERLSSMIAHAHTVWVSLRRVCPEPCSPGKGKFAAVELSGEALLPSPAMTTRSS